jgi:ketosteroid isomerase-like protein
MSDIIAKGEQLYAALTSGDLDILRRVLSPNFRGELTAGLPQGLGRRYEGLETMIGEGWGRIGALFAMQPQVEQLYVSGGTLIARGSYVGTAKPTGKSVRAAFAHFWKYDGDQFTGVYQVTDSATWQRALT